MKIKEIKLKHFKRFDDITIDLGDDPKKIIALVGPNGCGKSTIFDSFEEKQKDYKRANQTLPPTFFSKLFYSIIPGLKSENYNKNDSIKLTEKNDIVFGKKSFYIRSPYRFTSRLNVSTIKTLPSILEDINRPASSIDIDSRLQENYERLLGQAWNEYQYGKKSGPEMREELVGKINSILSNVIEIKISHLGDVVAGKGQLFFEKGSSKDFPYENLSSGEKEVVDIIIDLIVKTPEFDETIYCIDEPELHLNTSIQRKLLIEIEKLIPDNCQLWVATHSIGFLRALQEELKDKCQVLDFSEADYFNSACIIKPIKPTRKNWQRIFQTALEDITGLVAPKIIIYCEGKIQNSLDEKMFNIIFEETHHEALFIASSNKDCVQKNATLALTVLNKAFSDVSIIALIDRDDDLNDIKISSVKVKKLKRREFENYLLDENNLRLYCQNSNLTFIDGEYKKIVKDIINDDVKSLASEILSKSCGGNYNTDTRLELAKNIKLETEVYKELESEIFNEKT